MSRKSQETRERILKTTWKLLETAPAKTVRMSDIAKAADLTRQALYLHFPKRAELMIATARYLDEYYDSDTRLAPSRKANSGKERLDAFIEAWGNFIPLIYGVGRAFMAMQDTDEAAATAWADRMNALKDGCRAAVDALTKDSDLRTDLDRDKAIDLLWTLLSVRNWEQLRHSCGWSQEDYVSHIKTTAQRVLIQD